MIATQTPGAIRPGLEKNIGATVNAQRPASSVQTFFRSRCLIAAVILVVTLSGCGGPRRDLTGKWRGTAEGSTMIWEFAANGSVKMGSTQGRYSFGDRDRIKIESPSGISVYELEVSGDRMALKDPRGSSLEFTRVK